MADRRALGPNTTTPWRRRGSANTMARRVSIQALAHAGVHATGSLAAAAARSAHKSLEPPKIFRTRRPAPAALAASRGFPCFCRACGLRTSTVFALCRRRSVLGSTQSATPGAAARTSWDVRAGAQHTRHERGAASRAPDTPGPEASSQPPRQQPCRRAATTAERQLRQRQGPEADAAVARPGLHEQPAQGRRRRHRVRFVGRRGRTIKNKGRVLRR